MEKKRLEWRVGLFILIGLVLLGVLLVQFSKGITFSPTYELYLTSRNAGGLKINAQVLMAGVQVGSVKGVELSSDGKAVNITLQIYKRYVIHKDARFAIQQSGFLGDQYVAIIPTNNEGAVFAGGDHATAQEPFDLQEVARSAAGFIDHIDKTAKELNDMITDVRREVLTDANLTNLSVSVVNLRHVSEEAMDTVNNVNLLFTTNAPMISESINTLNQASVELSHFAGSLNEIVDTNRPSIAMSVSNIEASTAALRKILEEAQAGKGPAGTLLRNEEMATNMAQIAHNLSITTSNLNRLGLWGILWAKKTPREKPAGKAGVSP